MFPSIPGYTLHEVLHDAAPRVVYRGVDASGKAVVLKTLASRYPTRLEVAEIRREYTLMRRLQAIPVEGLVRVERLVPHGEGNVAMVMEPFGRSLDRILAAREGRPLDYPTFYTLAVQIAKILGRIHEACVVHKDIVPRNLLCDETTLQVRVIDFGIASELDHERQSSTVPGRLEGSLPYLSPEQTGRMNRDVDYRSDYYSLGVTLFELITGRLPFEADTVLEWVHQHIGRPPPDPRAFRDDVPAPLAAVLLKLLAKDASERYQSTFGLVHDLLRIQEAQRSGRTLRAFQLGAKDTPHRFDLPVQLFGRERELAALHDALERATHGPAVFCAISGLSGVGKSALVGELARSIASERGSLIQGKYDQFGRNTPYSALVTALRTLFRQIVGESAHALADWRKRLLDALGSNAGLLTALIPELETILGRQPPPPDLPPSEARNRFQLVFVDFLRAITEVRPLVLFLDDLQWADAPTLNLLQRLAKTGDLRGLLLIGAFRSNAITPPLAMALAEIEEHRPLLTIALEPLSAEAIAELTAATVRTTPERCESLSRIVFEKSGGNPFFARSLLKAYHAQGALRFDPDTGRWRWDEDALRAAHVGDDVVDFVVRGLRRLAPTTQTVLSLCACIGNTFDFHTLVLLHGDPDTTRTALDEAMRVDAIAPLTDDYRLVGLDQTGSGASVNAWYRFRHDRLQQAAYALIPPDERPAVHLRLGRLLAEHSDMEGDALLAAVSHLNLGRGGITDPAERKRLAEFNLRAGEHARKASAYPTALELFQVGLELGPDPSIRRRLAEGYQACCYLTGDYERAEAWSERLLAEAPDALARARVLATRTRQYATTGRMQDSIRAAIEGLRLLGMVFEEDPTNEDLRAELDQIQVHLRGRPIHTLIDAPACTDPVHLEATRLLMEIFAAAFLSGSGTLFPYLVARLVNLSLAHGNSPESAFAYAAYGMLLCGALDDPATGYAFGRLGVALNERLDDLALKSRVIYVYTMFVHHWTEPWKTMTPWFQRGIEAGYQSGDLLYLAYSAQDCILWDPTLDLPTATREQRKYLAIVRDTGYRDSYDSGSLYLQMELNFMGRTRGPFSMDTDDFDEVAVVEGMRARGFMTGLANHHIYKAEIHHLYEDFEGAMVHVEAQEALLASAMSLPQLVRFHIVSFLTRAALLGERPDEAERLRPPMERSHRQMERWAAHCPHNFLHLALLMRAEWARLDGRLEEALQLYERSAEQARTTGFRRDEAIAHELAGRCLCGAGLAKAAEGYFRAAIHQFERWGATRKVLQLERRYPYLVQPSSPTTLRTMSLTSSTSGSLHTVDLDLASVMRASQAIAGELRLDQLWDTTLDVLIENAGARWGCFIVPRDEGLWVYAAKGDNPRAQARAPLDPLALPATLLRSALRRKAPVVLGDARTDTTFGRDPCFQAHDVRSVLCLPLVRHGTFEGVIYLENPLTTDAFTDHRIEVLKLLSAQAAISTENAKLYEAQARLVKAQRRFVPDAFLKNLGHRDIANVELGESVAREMSVMFSDLRGFTPITEKLGPTRVIALLNGYFSAMEIPIADHGGFIDSFNGDEIMALFPGDPECAVHAGIAMWRALDRFNAHSAHPPLVMGVGVNTGELVLGTVGGRERLKCGVVGDPVNLASRIEQLTKRYGSPMLIGQETHDRLRDPHTFSLRLVDRVAVKGKTEGVRVYEVLDAETPERRARKERTRPLLERAWACYMGRDFSDALTALRDAYALDPSDVVLSLLAQRCEQYLAVPPPPSWDGSTSLHHK